MAAVHPFGAFIGCQLKRIRCAHRIKVNAGLYGHSITSRHIKLKSNRDNVTY